MHMYNSSLNNNKHCHRTRQILLKDSKYKHIITLVWWSLGLDVSKRRGQSAITLKMLDIFM